MKSIVSMVDTYEAACMAMTMRAKGIEANAVGTTVYADRADNPEAFDEVVCKAIEANEVVDI